MQLQEQRTKAIADARAILDSAKSQKRGMNADEVRRYDALMAEADSLKATIERENAQSELDNDARRRSLAASANNA